MCRSLLSVRFLSVLITCVLLYYLHAASERLPLSVNDAEHGAAPPVEVLRQVETITNAIAEGARAFLFAEYQILAIFVVLFGAVIFFADGATNGWAQGGFSALSFFLGGVTSIVSGYIGMAIAVRANGRTCVKAYAGYPDAFRTAFKAGCVMGFALVSLGLLILYATHLRIQAGFLQRGRYLEPDPLLRPLLATVWVSFLLPVWSRRSGKIHTKAADVGVGSCRQGREGHSRG